MNNIIKKIPIKRMKQANLLLVIAKAAVGLALIAVSSYDNVDRFTSIKEIKVD